MCRPARLWCPADRSIDDDGVPASGATDGPAEVLHGGRGHAAHDDDRGSRKRRVRAPGLKQRRGCILDVRKIRKHENDDGLVPHAATDSERFPPSFSHSASAPAERFHAVTSQPLPSRLTAMGKPMNPSPTKPAVLAVIFRVHLTSLWFIFQKLFNILASIQYDEHHDD